MIDRKFVANKIVFCWLCYAVKLDFILFYKKKKNFFVEELTTHLLYVPNILLHKKTGN